MTKRATSAYLPIAIVFGAVGIVFLATGNSIWVAFLPLAITFFVLSQRKDDDDDDESVADASADDGPRDGDDDTPPVDRG